MKIEIENENRFIKKFNNFIIIVSIFFSFVITLELVSLFYLILNK